MELWKFLEDINKELSYLKEIETEEYESIEKAIENAYLEKPKWNRVNNVVAVFADLANSTNISNRKTKRVYAKFLEAVGYPFVKIFNEFNAEFIDIKGDGGLALFSGNYAEIYAFLAAETFKTFQEEYAKKQLSQYDVNYYFGIGIAKGDLLVKKVGVRGNNNFFVWAGDAVNNAALTSKDIKNISQITSIGITLDIYDKFNQDKFKDYLVYSCGCPKGKKVNLWKEFSIKDEKNFRYKKIESNWCKTHGEEYLNKILEIIGND
ncbi:Adenylate and Guanylate cyclase catalytic domain-containing protein [Persephonella hydrogeniphila]|uniref:Adenylate and Guanylate cyclase catalytic domain-containing protein n=1 Tax=Persephonella hydrogeniphila TaxID=198703 RepID=A0A285N6Q7_9AQUI|nr:adenylate/guanylate cyclase domain-containing protein [Persephonella hydrogeniphila]SNZ03666.1 Adenylate and Guanylate cyclase catalytic domain-containing protein [Persephonella hydrogeniphila]